MKKIITFLLLVSINTVFAQSTELLPGVVLPQMTTTQRTDMVNPTNGSLVFDKTTQSYWFRQSGAWVELPKGGSTSNFWQTSGLGGNEIRNTNTGGFWSKNPVGMNYSSNNTSNPPTAPVNEAGTRLMWIPGRSAFRVGTITDENYWAADSIGLFSFASGINTKASGFGSTAMGNFSSASGKSGVALGYNSHATANGAVAIGYNAYAHAEYATALGFVTQALGVASTALGSMNVANGPYALVAGHSTQANGTAATALGASTRANGDISLATGLLCVASGEFSTAMGTYMNTNNKKGAFAIGDSDPDNEGQSLVGAADQFVARFKNGYYLMTSGNANPRTGVSISNGQTAWSAISDSTRKERFILANGEDFLLKLRSLRLGSWNYKNQKNPSPERFYGPMAQELFAAYGKDKYGTIGTDTSVSTLNMDGLLFIFAQTLEKRTAQLQAENDELKGIVAKLDARLTSLETADRPKRVIRADD
ncbi:tail fiber domain-containing protein [Emticicia agri]|uniref:Peptidase S74 domain-containing protein n=1 Tax=Emticicia agri TaxID=2492393 RepID=A0A4Q5LT84_9BACT|nr:tail fiber domain-containing protein [Emticicia agri]RYU92639.1 hypothetical protein EWM59_26155 [Emticicia agri]